MLKNNERVPIKSLKFKSPVIISSVNKSIDKDFILSDYRVFFDFDNTITNFDVLDDIIKRFSINDEWGAIEKEWSLGNISSQECLERQLRLIRITKKDLFQYLKQIKIDTHFYKLFTYLEEKGMNPIIVSDSFSSIIKYILRNNGIKGVKLYSNRIKFNKDRLFPLFPYKNKLCAKCANCKTMHLLNHGSGNKPVIYIGDGLSDVCPAQYADLVFAKKDLKNYLKNKKRNCVEFQDLSQVYEYFKEPKPWSVNRR